MGAEVAARAEVDQVVGSHDDSGRDGSVHRGLVQTGRGTTDLNEVTKDVLDLVNVLDSGYYLHLRTTRWADKRIDLVDSRQ
jgi:hypothetical protein